MYVRGNKVVGGLRFGGQSCGMEPWVCGIWHCSQAESVRTELNCRPPNRCQRPAHCGGKHTHIWWPEVSEGKCFVWVERRLPGKKDIVERTDFFSLHRRRLNWLFSFTVHYTFMPTFISAHIITQCNYLFVSSSLLDRFFLEGRFTIISIALVLI